MEVSTYQSIAVSTAIYPKEYSIMYLALGMCGEAGEAAEKIKKIYRDKGGNVNDEDRAAIVKELGDVCWYIANIANELNASFDDVLNTNADKILARKANDTLHGTGDNR